MSTTGGSSRGSRLGQSTLVLRLEGTSERRVSDSDSSRAFNWLESKRLCSFSADFRSACAGKENKGGRANMGA